MHNPITYYSQRLEKHQRLTEKLHKRPTLFSTFRILAFLTTAFSIYLTFWQWQVAVIILVIGIILFIYLLTKYVNIKRESDLTKALAIINEDEIKINSGKFFDRDQGLEFQDPNHYYSLDIDLFGPGSFYQFINRTSIKEGSLKLANALKANHIEDINMRQEAIKELASKPEWRQYFMATASLIKVETPAVKIIDWLKIHRSFLPKTMRWIPLVFSIASLGLLSLIIFNVLDTSSVGY